MRTFLPPPPTESAVQGRGTNSAYTLGATLAAALSMVQPSAAASINNDPVNMVDGIGGGEELTVGVDYHTLGSLPPATAVWIRFSEAWRPEAFKPDLLKESWESLFFCTPEEAATSEDPILKSIAEHFVKNFVHLRPEQALKEFETAMYGVQPWYPGVSFQKEVSKSDKALARWIVASYVGGSLRLLRETFPDADIRKTRRALQTVIERPPEGARHYCTYFDDYSAAIEVMTLNRMHERQCTCGEMKVSASYKPADGSQAPEPHVCPPMEDVDPNAPRDFH